MNRHRLLRSRRRTVARRQAADALRDGNCLFASHGNCDPALGVVGLRRSDDHLAVICCRVHITDLRQLRPYEAERLARYLHVAFVNQPAPAPQRQESATLVHVQARA